MKCAECGNELVKKERNYVANLENCIIIIKNVPALVCPVCNEVYYENDVFEHIENIVSVLRTVINDVAIVDFQDKIA